LLTRSCKQVVNILEEDREKAAEKKAVHSEKFFKKLLNDVLEPLGLKTRRGRVRSSFQDLCMKGIFIKDIASGAVCMVTSPGSFSRGQVPYCYKYLVCCSYEHLADALCGADWLMSPGAFDSKHPQREICNPYFRCSIDGLCIARDLMPKQKE